MGQMGFFELGNRYSGLDAKNEPLLNLDGVVPWEDLRARLEAVWRRADKARKSRAGRKPWDAIVMFKTHSVRALHLSDDQVEHQIRDRLSFMRFLGSGSRGPGSRRQDGVAVPRQLTQAGVIEALFETFDGYLKDQGYLAWAVRSSTSIVAVPKQRNSREENARIKAGETPAGWEDKPAKRRQKDVEARWTKKHGKSHSVTRTMSTWTVGTSWCGASCERRGGARQPSPRRYPGWGQHGFDCVGGQRLPLGGVEAALKEKGLRSRIHRKGRRNQPLSEREKQGTQDPFVGSGPRRACLRGPEQRHGRDAGT